MSMLKKFIRALGIENWSIILSGSEALEMCDELAETIYENVPGPVMKQHEKDRHLKVVTICVYCHKAKIKGESCIECELKK